VAAGCGGSAQKAATPTKTSPQAPTKQQYIAEADAFCHRSKREFTPIQAQLSAADKASASESQDAYFAALVPLIDKEIKVLRRLAGELKALPRPSANAPDLDGYFATLDQGIAALQTARSALNARDSTRLQAVFAKTKSLTTQAARYARAYGFKVCGNPARSETGAQNRSASPGSGRTTALGDPLEFSGRDVSIEVTAIKLTEVPTTQLSQPAAGKHYVGVELRIKNTGSSVYETSPSLNAKLVLANGTPMNTATIVDPNSTCSSAGFASSVSISPGDLERGCLPFEVPNGAKPAKFQFAASAFGSDTGEWTLS
jgi:hypothetical protein